MSKPIDLPILIAGERRSGGDDAFHFSYDGGVEITLPRPSREDMQRVVETDRRPLRDLSIDDITLFFDKVSLLWGDPENEWRRRALDLGCRISGYPLQIVEFDMRVLGETLKRAKQYDFISTDIGDPALLDEWRPSKAVYRRCWPVGLITHIMVGNVPLAGLFTIYRSLATKNVTVTKLPRRDVVTALCFAQCVYEVDPDHPVVRSLSTLYWQAESEVEDLLLNAADVVSVWGRGESVESVKRRLRQGTDLIEFGPKRSFALILDGVADLDRAGRRAAHDIALYDQEGCFSLQELYIVGEHKAFTEALATWLERGSKALPRRPLTADAEAHIQRARLEAIAEGWEVIAPENTDWTIIVTDGPASINEHPLGRLVYVHPIEQVEELLPLIDRDVQTVAVEPWAQVWQVSDTLASAGVDRLVPLGRMGVFRPGFIHDGFHPMARMVRWSIIERDLSYKYQFAGAHDLELEETIITARLTPDELSQSSAAATQVETVADDDAPSAGEFAEEPRPPVAR